MKNSESYLIFSIGEFNYALPVESVKRVIHSVQVTEIPDSPEILAGIINIGGNVIGVINISRYLDIPVQAINLNDRFIIVRHGVREAALIVNSVDYVVDVPFNDIIERESIYKGLEQAEVAIRITDKIIPAFNIGYFFKLYDDNYFKDFKDIDQS
jgi:purine-binding chemotaxis protein CheW